MTQPVQVRPLRKVGLFRAFRSALVVLLSGLGCAPEAPSEPGPWNYVLISLDTLRADRVGRPGSDLRSLTPALDQLSAESIVFRAAYAQSNETLFSHTSIFTGQYPSKYGDLDYLTYRLDSSTPTLASFLTGRGYRTEAVVAGGHLAPVFGVQAGFGRYRSMQDFSTFQETMPQALEALDRLAKEDAPFLLLVHGYDCHTPYVKPGPLYRLATPDYAGFMISAATQPLTYERIFKQKFYPQYQPPELTSADDVHFVDPAMFDDLAAYATRSDVEVVPMSGADSDFLVGSYDAAARHADTFVGILLDELERLELDERTVVIAFSDHGEDLLEHGYVNHRLALYDENLHVPLIVRIPGKRPEVVQSLVGLVDLLPTIRELSGLEPGSGPGTSLIERPISTDRAVYAESLRGEVSIRTRQGRLILPREVDTSGPPPSHSPSGALALNEKGQAVPWDARIVAPLWHHLQANRPQ